MGSVRVGVDVGGTFTDFTVFGAEGGQRHFKLPSTPGDPSAAILAGIDLLLKQGINPSDIEYLGHGTTVATNTVIQRCGGVTGLITTAGFRDVLDVGRQTRPDLYDFFISKPAPLVRRAMRMEVRERMTADGQVLLPLVEEDVLNAAEKLREHGVEAIAVCLLHSYGYPEHERRVKALLEPLFPGTPICLSSDILPEFREYERLSTTVMNAYLTPRVSGYFDRFLRGCQERSLAAVPYTIHSNGGLMPPETAKRYPVRTCLSGPAAGVVGASIVAKAAGIPNVVTYDVGGTSTDVSLIAGGLPAFTSDGIVADYPVRCPMVDVHVIGAGGGSIARVDEGDALKVGPSSAGADPGPAAYGLGGTQPTLTDANVVLGRFDPDAVFGGHIVMNVEAARLAIEPLADRLSKTVEETALGIVRIAIANMARAVRKVSVERGHSLDDFALMAFGGAGPLYAPTLMDEVEVRRCLIPQAPGTMCATGVLLADLTQDYISSTLVRADEKGWAVAADHSRRLASEAEAWLEAEDVAPESRSYLRVIDARYVGQNHEIHVDEQAGSLEEFVAAFHAAHRSKYGYDLPDRPVEIVNCRLRALGALGATLDRPEAVVGDVGSAVLRTRPVYIDATLGWQETPIYQRSLMPNGCSIEGPAIITEDTSTIFLLPRQTARIDQFRNIIIEAK